MSDIGGGDRTDSVAPNLVRGPRAPRRALSSVAASILTLLCVAAPRPAQAQVANYAEVALGIDVPLEPGFIEPGPVIGLRVSTPLLGNERSGIAGEIGFRWQPLRPTEFLNRDYAFSNRVRVAGGLRLYHPVHRRAWMFARFAVGLDVLQIEATQTTNEAVEEIDVGETEVALLLDPGVGLVIGMGASFGGIAVSLPRALHATTDRDIEVLLTWGGALW